jgi:RimJ/RimL family protein N-acetyltransferase
MFARTERLLLRPGWPEDAPALAQSIGEQAIIRNLAMVPWPYGIEDARAFLDAEANSGEINMLVFRRTLRAPQLIGGTGLRRDGDGEFELGYWISRRHWGLGYATEAADAVVTLARGLGIGRLRAGHFVDNPASGRVLSKLGFRRSGDIVQRHSRGRGEHAPFLPMTLSLSPAAIQEDDAEPDVVRMIAA